ncbi:MAG TPA: hypothetical protein VFB92_22755 [Vicinamibacterales bacterium]|jgi:antitoxin (DNA-binding transcriptional repressor) of toxin-antitoxin stability system|nr:hypothetical protein [Vicinamibacterales bacterium]
MNRRYTVARVRQRLSDALDEAEKGIPVIIERRGTRFQLSLAPPRKARSVTRKPTIEVLDPAVAAGNWSWAWTKEGLRFRSRRGR